jgi:hypothetical protein
MSKKIVFKYTSRSRPENFMRGLNSIIDNCVDDNYWVICSFDSDDLSMDSIRELLDGKERVSCFFGKSKSKIDAINRDLCELIKDWDILINMSDDMVFIHKGFDNLIRQAFESNFPSGDGFLHIHDGNQNQLATMSIIDKKHFDRFGYIYHPDYVSVFCDNEAQDVAKMLGCYYYLGDGVRLIEHRHPLHNKSYPMDAQYFHTESFYQQDSETYYRRRALNFGL